MTDNEELIKSLTAAFAGALQSTLSNLASPPQTNNSPKPPPFSVNEYRLSDGTSVEDYFKRFDWALELSKVPTDQYANYARVHIGTELNNALKFLASPELPENLTYVAMKKLLKDHFDCQKNKFAESIKFRKICQEKGEPIARIR